MLKGIPEILSPQLLKVLCEMGHSDRIVIADGNFPVESMGKDAIVVRCDGHGVPELLDAILTVIPLDSYVEKPGIREILFFLCSEGQANLCSLHSCLLVTHVCRGKHGSGSIGRRKRNRSCLRGRAAGYIVLSARDIEQVDRAILEFHVGQHGKNLHFLIQ